MTAPNPGRRGGDLVVETLEALGATTVFGIPGQHALGLFDALSRSRLQFVSSRVENNAAFAADGYARATGRPGVLFVSTGPGALTSLAGLQEAYASSVPMIVVSSQVPRRGLGGARNGMLHQLDDQPAAAANVAKSTWSIREASQIPSAIEEAWRLAVSAPAGPTWIEIPQDILLEATAVTAVSDVRGDALDGPRPRAELLDAAAELLGRAERPVILAGGGVRRASAENELRELAERIQAPVVMTPGGNGAFPRDHPLSVQSWVEDRYTTELMENADVLLVLGSALGEITSNYFTFAPQGALIHVDAEARVLESNHPAMAIHSDARLALEGLLDRVSTVAHPEAEAIVSSLLRRIQGRLDAQDLRVERQLIDDIRASVPDDAHTFWDMTIAAYWAWSAWDPRAGSFHSAQGAGGLGFGFPAAIGAAMGTNQRVLAVSGDGGAMYSIAELATARQHDAPVTWIIIDDGGYGILREYMEATFGTATATELHRPDFVALAKSFGVDARYASPATLASELASAWNQEGPNVIVVPVKLAMFEPTHL